MCLSSKEIEYFQDELPDNMHIVEKPEYTFIQDIHDQNEYWMTFFHKDVIMKSASKTTLETWIEFLDLDCTPDDLRVITQSELSHS